MMHGILGGKNEEEAWAEGTGPRVLAARIRHIDYSTLFDPQQEKKHCCFVL